MFDLDIYNGPAGGGFTELLSAAKEDGIIVVTNPCFDIWLLLHVPDAYTQHIQGDEKQILCNSKISNKHTYTSKKASDILGFNTKGNFRCESLLKNIDNAIKEERQICKDEKTMLDRIGCNNEIIHYGAAKKAIQVIARCHCILPNNIQNQWHLYLPNLSFKIEAKGLEPSWFGFFCFFNILLY